MENTENNELAENIIIAADDNMINEPLIINEEMKEFLLETSNWGRFLAILGFVGLGLMVIASIAMVVIGSSFSYHSNGLPSMWLALIYIIIAVLYYFPISYLLSFSNNIKSGIRTNDNDLLTSGFQNLKSHYKFLGIFTIVILSLYTFIILFAVLAMAFR